jgi:hypothetical protein
MPHVNAELRQEPRRCTFWLGQETAQVLLIYNVYRALSGYTGTHIALSGYRIIPYLTI